MNGRVLQASTVEQHTDQGHTVSLHKEIVQVDGEVPLVMVRKHLPQGPSRPPVLLVHGFAQNRYSWHHPRRSFSAWLAARGWDTWNLELRGHGRSRHQGQMGAEQFPDYVDDVRRATAALPDRPFQVGHSLGGAALYAAAALNTAQGLPQARGIIGIGALYAFGRHNLALRLLGQLTHSLRDTPLVAALQVRTRLFGHLLGRLYAVSDVAGYGFPISGWWPGSIEPEILQERLSRGFDWTSARVWMEMSRWAATGQVDWDADWARTDLPLLVIAGDRDHLMPPRDAITAYDRSGSHDKHYELFDLWHHKVHWGHLDLVLGKEAPGEVWPFVEGWMRGR